MPSEIDLAAVQGLLVSAFAHLQCAAFRLFRIDHAARARRWLAHVAAAVTPGKGKQEGWSLNLALTREGLEALGQSSDTLRTFPPAFTEGMASSRRSRILGDVDLNQPVRWRWGGHEAPVHVLLLIYGEGENEIAREKQRWRPPTDAGMTEVLTLDAGRQPDSREHFGFMDGIGQPVVAGSGRLQRQLERTGHATELPAGEFILGYGNAYGEPSLSPTVDPALDPRSALPASGIVPDRRDLGLNGSYLVFRQLSQDVPAFWKFVSEAGAALWPDDPNGPTRAAAKMVGRWPTGAALALYPDADPYVQTPPVLIENDFGYAEGDAYGLACPLGAHIRRANPRDARGPDPEAARASANRHRLLRRGRSYGRRLENPLQDDGEERGLHFICLNADLERQFEFVQQTWINNPVYAGLEQETDPLVGDQSQCRRTFTIQADPLRLRVSGLRPFVTVRGGAYFFLPSIPALRFLFPPDAP
jgi:Dyp-type peroxidase family